MADPVKGLSVFEKRQKRIESLSDNDLAKQLQNRDAIREANRKGNYSKGVVPRTDSEAASLVAEYNKRKKVSGGNKSNIRKIYHAYNYGPQPQQKNMGGMMTDELGYMRGGMTEEARGPIKYSKGGAIAGKNFKGSF